ncbi:Suppressor of Sensor Kinase (SLN1) [Coemansia sp. RSA 562]|nr:Suppressor of Sensor Kinase (SLN1) [Coemansia sp. RSA 562]
MDTDNEASVELAKSFSRRLFYLYGYPGAPSCDLGTHAMDKPDAHGEMLRRQFQARRKVTAMLEGVGARVTMCKDEGAAASLVVIPDDCSAEHRAEALALGRPVVSESALLQQIQSLQIASKEHRRQTSNDSDTGKASADTSTRHNALPNTVDTIHSESSKGRLRNSVSLDEMRVREHIDSQLESGTNEDTNAETPDSRSQAQSLGNVQRHPTFHKAPVSTSAILATGSHSVRFAQMAPNRASEGVSEGPYDLSSDSDSNELDNDRLELNNDEHRERTEWHQMLTSALCSQVVDGEKKRLNAQADSYLFDLTDNEYAEHLSELVQSHEDRSFYMHAHTELWLGCRAAIRGRTPLQEKNTLESLRNHHVDTTLRAVIDFSAETAAASTVTSDENPQPTDFSAQCLAQLQKLLRRVDYVECLYPTLRALGEAKPVYTSTLFQTKFSAITSWTNVSVRIELLYTMIQRWTGSRDLSLYATDDLNTYVSSTFGITGGNPSITFNTNSNDTDTPLSPINSTRATFDAMKKRVQHTPFVERLLKENGMKMIFERKILIELEQVMISARRDLIEIADVASEIGLPVVNRHMQELLLFPPRLLQTCLQIRLQSAENLVNPPLAQVDQLIEDIRDSLSVACRVKRTFISLATRVGKWNPGIRLDPEYDTTLRRCLHTYFRLVHRKLVLSKGTSTGAGTRDFEILDSQWPFLLEIVRDIDGGHYELIMRYCQQMRRSMKLWIGILAQKLEGPEGYDSADSRCLGKWINKTLQDIRTPILKAQRLVRTLQNALTNSTDYTFEDPFPVLAQLVDSKHVLIYTSGEWESHGVYIIGSQSMLEKSHLAREMLSACIVDDVMNSEQYHNCYLLVIRTDAEFNWTGPTVVPESDQIAYQDLELSPGQMRLIAPGQRRLERYRQWLERLNIAAERQPWQTYTAVTDEIIHNATSSRGKHQQHQENQTAASSMADSDQKERTGYSESEGTASEAGSKSGVRSTGSSWFREELAKYSELSSKFAALRPSLEPLDRQLARINSPGWNAAAQQGLIEDMSKKRTRAKGKPPAPAHVHELSRAHNPKVQREWTLLKYSITQMLDALTQMPDMLRTLHLDFHERGFYEARGRRGGDAGGRHTEVACQGANCDLLEQIQEAFLFVSNTSSRGSRFLDLKAERYVRLTLLHMCVGWCAFIAEDCMANERRTFRWAMQALEFTMTAGKSNSLQVLGRADWQLLKAQVAGCVTLMISHFDVLGKRNDDLDGKERQKRREQELARMEPNVLLSLDGIGANYRTHLMQRQRLEHAQQVDIRRDNFLNTERRIGHALEVTARPEDQTLRLLAASSSNITLRWQMGRYVGGGAFGLVHVGYNLDSGELMAVKEIRFPSRPGVRGDAARGDSGRKIVQEMEVMSVLQHPNIVTYYGIEVHRDKVYLFMELCSRGSLAQLVRDQGKLDEASIRVFVVQMLRGLEYLHRAGISHRDIKCDNTLLDENMNIKLVDFGAAKVLNQQSQAATRRSRATRDGASLAGTPMYMAPEVILGSNGGSIGPASRAGEKLRPGRLGAQDIWALGCCIVEMVTGNPPWAHLDNEWAIMYHVVSGDPPLPAAADISAEGLRFVRRCFTRQPADRPQAADLLRDEWLTETLQNMERLEERGHNSGKLAGTPIDYISSMDHALDVDSDAAVPSARSSHRSELGVDYPAHRMRAASTASSAAPSPTRSRKSSMHSKNLSGDLRFKSSAANMSNADVFQAILDASRSSNGGRLRAYSGSSAANNADLRAQSHTSGSPGSAISQHVAWPFNKPSSSQGTPGAASSPGSPLAVPNAMWNPLSTVNSEHLAVPNSTSINSVATMISPDALSTTEEELLARYASPSIIYQTLSASATSPMRTSHSMQQSAGIPSRLQHTSAMGSPADSLSPAQSVSQFAVETFSDKGGSSPPTEPGEGGMGNRSQSLPLDTTQPETGCLTTNDIHELTETTRLAVSTLLRIPLEGADVAGVSGWLGEGNTPVELLNADEIKETVATTSQNIVRQREHQLRQKQEMHDVLRRRQFKDMMLGKTSGDGAIDTTEALSAQDIAALQRPEPPALYPLPPVDDDYNSSDDGA